MPFFFLVPAILAGLAAIGIPLVLHLRRRKREKPMRFPSLMFLQRIRISTARRRRITDIPLLLLRALIVALAVLAFARPVWHSRQPVAASATARRVVLLVDRSMSMSHLGVWPAARDSARAVVAGLSAGDRIAVIAFDEESSLEQPLTLDHAAATGALSRITPGSRATRFSAGIRAAREILQREADHTGGEVVLVSDMQRSGAVGSAELSLPPGVTLRVIAVSHGVHANASVVGVTAQRDTATDQRRARLIVSAEVAARNLPAPRTVHATLTIGGRAVSKRDVLLPTDGSKSVAFDAEPLPVAGARVSVSIDADSLAADDSYQIVVPPQLVRRVLLVTPADMRANETLYLERALQTGGDPVLRIERRNVSSLDVTALHDALAVILYDVAVPQSSVGTMLAAWVHDGGGLIEMASTRLGARGESSTLLPATVHGMVDRTSSDGGVLGSAAMEHPIFAAFRGSASAPLGPSRFYRYARATASADGQIVARFDDGLPALLERSEGNGRVLLSAVPLDAESTDFPFQPTFLPYLRALVMHAAGSATAPLARTAGDAWSLPPLLHNAVVRAPSGTLTRPEHGAVIQLPEAGFYTVFEGRASGDPAMVLAINPVARESDLAVMAPGDLLIGVGHDSLSTSATAAAAAVEIERRQQLWRTLLILAIAALVAETVMASRGWRGTAVRIAGGEGGTT